MNTINPQVVEATLIDCLFTDEEAPDGKPPKDAVMAEGILRNFGSIPSIWSPIARKSRDGWTFFPTTSGMAAGKGCRS